MRIQEFDFSVNLLRVILWQYDKAENLKAWLQFKQDFADSNHTDFFENWFNDVFNLETANAFGLAVWAIILEVPLLVNLPPVSVTKIGWGFGEFRENFNNGNFNTLVQNGAQLLTLDQRRIALKMRYQQLTTRGTVPEINRILIDAFGDLGTVYVRDNNDMTTDYIFEFPIPPWVTFIFEELDVFPTPSAVEANLVEI
jgi:hypothetical protein